MPIWKYALEGAAIGAVLYGIGRALVTVGKAAMKPGVPEGKAKMGVTIRTFNHTKYLPGKKEHNPEALVKWLKENNFAFVEVGGAWANPSGKVTGYYRPGETEEMGAALKEAGIGIGIFGWPDPAADVEYRDKMQQMYDVLDASWYKHDPEKPYMGAGPYTRKVREASARYLMDWSTKQAPTDITSYGGGQKSVPTFPWEIFADGARYGRPQWYDKASNWSAKKVQGFADQWRKFFPVIGPILSGVNTNSPTQMVNEARLFVPTAGGPLFSYWDFYWLAISKARTQAARQIGAEFAP